jgi:DNA-damage-inducible protein J
MQTATAATTTMTIRLDKDVKKQAQTIYSELGVDMTTAINVFLRQSIRSKGFPFDVNLSVPNKVTLEAMKNTQDNKDMHGPFNSVKELMESLNADD